MSNYKRSNSVRFDFSTFSGALDVIYHDKYTDLLVDLTQTQGEKTMLDWIDANIQDKETSQQCYNRTYAYALSCGYEPCTAEHGIGDADLCTQCHGMRLIAPFGIAEAIEWREEGAAIRGEL